MSSKQVTTSKRLIHNTLFNVITRLTTAVIGFLLVRFFLSKLGEEKYGIWILVGSIFHYRRMLNMGLNSAINRYIPVYLAKDNNEGVQRVISTSLFFFSSLGIVLVLATLVIYYNIGSWFAIDQELVSVAGFLVLVVGFCFALAMPLHLSSALLSGLQRYDIMNSVALIALITRVVLLVILLSMGYGLITMGLIFGLIEIFIRITQFTFAKKLLPQFSISSKNIDFKLLREMVAYSINTLLYTMGAVIIYKASDIVIGIFMSVAYVARFYVVAVLVLLLSQLLQVFTAAVKPAVSDLDARNDKLRLREVAFLSQKYALLLLVPSICFFVVMGKDFLSVWVGAKFSQSVINELGPVLAILAIGHGLRLSQHSNFIVLVGKGEHRVFGIFIAASAILSIILSIFAVKVLNMGLIGIAWSHFLPLTITSGTILPIYFNWKMQISLKESISEVWWPALLGVLPTIAMISVWKYLASPNSWLQLGIVVVASAALTFLSSWFLSFTELERKRFLRVLVQSSRVIRRD